MKKDILISIASRDEEKKHQIQTGKTNPEMLDRTLKMLYDTCNDKKNFDIQVIICKDQVNLYKETLDKWKIKPELTKYVENSWLELVQLQHKKMKEGYYFFMFMPDDLFELKEGWDSDIIAHKKKYEDDLFVLFTQYAGWGRTPEELKISYSNLKSAETLFEQQPIWTYKFGEFFYYLFQPPFNYKKGREIIIAVILHFLNAEGHNRHVESNVFYKELINNYNHSLAIFSDYNKQKKKDYPDIRKIVKKMKKYIKNYHS